MMKGVGILLMVFNHCPIDIFFLHRFIEIFHMPMFFILSGYLYKHKPLQEVIKRNTRFILLPYFATMIIVCLCSYTINRDTLYGGIILLGNARSTLGFSNLYNVGPLWFLTAYFMTQIYAYFIFLIKNELWRAITVITLFTFSCVYMLTIKTMPPFGILTGFGGLIYLYIGYCIKKYNESIKSLNINKKIIYFSLGFCYIISLIFGHSPMSWHIYKLWYIDVIGATVGTFLCYKFISSLKEDSNISKILSFCGLNSLAILCFHSIDRIMNITNLIANKIAQEDLQRWQIEIILKFVFIIIIFIMAYNIRFLRKLFNIHKLTEK